MTKKQGNALPAGIYKVFWKRGGWSWCAICDTGMMLKGGTLPKEYDRQILAINWGFAYWASGWWRKIAKVERAPLAGMPNER